MFNDGHWTFKHGRAFPAGGNASTGDALYTRYIMSTKLTYSMPGTTTCDNGKKLKHTWVFDYTGCTVGELIKPAARTAKIDVQNDVRKHPDMYPEDVPITVNMKQLVAGGRGIQMSPDQIMAYARANPEILDALLKMREDMTAGK